MKHIVNIALLDRFMRDETSEEEEQQLLIWFRSEKARADILDFYKNHWQEAKNSPEIDNEIQERMYRQIKARIQAVSSKEMKPVVKRTYLLKRWFEYAAVILLFIGIGVGTHLYTRQTVNLDNEYKVEADKGQRANVTLPDGTKVWLNSHSSLIYTANYGVKDRLVSLVGEAFFEVAKDKEHRFVVNASGIEVEALGTTFNVKAYKEDNTIITTLFTGSVKVTSDLKYVVLSEGEQVTLDKKNGKLAVKRPEILEYANMWRSNELAFNGQTLSEIALLLNRMYNVEVQFESEKIKEYRFSGVIRNNSLDNVFEIISLTAPITYKSEGDTIILSSKQ